MLRLLRSSRSSLAALLMFRAGFGWAEPQVAKVEPPGWWREHSHNPVRLLISGSELGNVRMEAPDRLACSNFVVTASGNYAFCDLFIFPNAVPGLQKLRFHTGRKEITADFEVLPPLDRNGKFGGFSPDDVIYLIMPDRFTNGDLVNDNSGNSPGMLDRSKPRHYHGGDFQGIIDRLPYLKDLGVTALWLTPWYDNENQVNVREKYASQNGGLPHGIQSTDYHGYSPVDFYGVEEHFGNLAQLQNLVETAQEMGLKVIQDQIANHTGPYHPWVASPPAPAWYNGSAQDHLDNHWEIWTTAHPDPPAAKLKATLEGWFLNILPDLNQNDPETATYLIQNSLWWIGITGVNGVRQDTLPYVPRSYWAKWTAALKREHPQLTILGEVFHKQPELVSFFQGGTKRFDGLDSGINTLFDYPLHYALRDVFARGESMTRLRQTLSADTNYPNPKVLVTFLGLHDTARFLNESGATPEKLKLAFTFLLTARGTPLIYYGDEIGMSGGSDPDNRRDFPGGWAGDVQSAFDPGGRTTVQADLHGHVKHLLQLRREVEALRRGDFTVLKADKETFAFARATAKSSVLVAFNNATQPRPLELAINEPLAREKELRDRVTNRRIVQVRDGAIRLVLPASSAVILTPARFGIASEFAEPNRFFNNIPQ